MQQKARQAYGKWKENNAYPGLHFKQVHRQKAVYPVRVGLSYRALGIREDTDDSVLDRFTQRLQ